jgi:hypothetical protein
VGDALHKINQPREGHQHKIKSVQSVTRDRSGWTYVCEGFVVDVAGVRGRRGRRRLRRRNLGDSDGARPAEEVDDPVAQADAGAPGQAFHDAGHERSSRREAAIAPWSGRRGRGLFRGGRRPGGAGSGAESSTCKSDHEVGIESSIS